MASLATMQASFDLLTQNSTDRNIMDVTVFGFSLSNLHEYGCWCYFDDNFSKGKSEPADKIDKHCRTLSKGYECAIIDGNEENEPCIPWEVEYTTEPISDTDLIPNMCMLKNLGNNCAVRTCIVEQTFVNNFIFTIFSGVKFDKTKLHSQTSNFVENNCSKNGGGNDLQISQSWKSCCGIYPLRKPFNTKSGKRACCGSKTYDNILMQCCEPDDVKLSC